MHRWLRWATLGLGLACADSAPHAVRPQLEPCRLEGLGVEARCGQLTVFENRSTQQGRRLQLRLAVVPAIASQPLADPLFILVGGPGQAATKAGPAVAQVLREVQRSRDVVLVDQRGTGGSNPLDCKDEEEMSLAKRFAPRLDLPGTRACKSALDADTALYTTNLAMDDLDDVRQALGYERINLWGGSYGTRAALVYLRQHPSHVRSLVLDGSAPFAMQLPLFAARDGQRSLDSLFEACQADPECKARFPQARAELDSLLQRLEREPESTRLIHPRTGLPETIVIEREGLSAALLNLLYVPALAGLIPLGVERASRGDYSTLVAPVEAFSNGVDLSAGMFLSVVCSEDLSRVSPEDVVEQTQGTFLGAGWASRLREQCIEWGAAALPEAYFAPIAGNVPSLLLSGDLDPVTPPRWGELVGSTLSPSRHVVVPGAGHGVTSQGCVPDLIHEFIDSLDPAALDASCVERLERPPFFTSMEGPSP
ncbi:MAG TPA: alpha/beta fold hydrolase [Polyangiaceae bacterium]|nr:alpha/beta fold hydrolase [Polyangiaceae bacterium]